MLPTPDGSLRQYYINWQQRVRYVRKLWLYSWSSRLLHEPVEQEENFSYISLTFLMKSRDGLRSEPLFSELPTAILVCIWASLPWLWSYFSFISSGLVSSAMGDPLSEQDRRPGHQIFGLYLISLMLGRVLTGKGPMATLFYPSLLSYSRSFSLRCGFSFPLLDFVLCPLAGTLSSLALPLQTLNPSWGPPIPQLTPLFPCSHCTLSAVSPWTVCANHFAGIIFCLLIVSSWVLSL